MLYPHNNFSSYSAESGAFIAYALTAFSELVLVHAYLFRFSVVLCCLSFELVRFCFTFLCCCCCCCWFVLSSRIKYVSGDQKCHYIISSPDCSDYWAFVSIWLCVNSRLKINDGNACQKCTRSYYNHFKHYILAFYCFMLRVKNQIELEIANRAIIKLDIRNRWTKFTIRKLVWTEAKKKNIPKIQAPRTLKWTVFFFFIFV